MDNGLDALEKSILSDIEMRNAASLNAPSLSERHQLLYFLSLSILSLTGYTFIFIFPIITLFIATSLFDKIISADSFLSALFILLEISIASFCGWISFLLYRVKIPHPPGRPLNKNEAPLLIKLIDNLQYEHNTSKIHAIKITDKFEINIVRTPRNGFPILFSNTLLIGLPLMQCLSKDQFEIALLKKISHLQKRLRRPSNWFYFQRQTWAQYNMEYRSCWKPPHGFMRVFFSLYAPLYKLLSQYASRKENLYTDIYTLKSINKIALVDMISISGISQHYLNNTFWPHLYNKAYKHKTPPYLPYSSIERNIQTQLNNEISQSWIDQSMTKKSSTPSKPSLHQRLANIGLQHILLPAPVMQSAATYYLQETLDIITQQMDKIWFMTHKFDWHKKYIKGKEEQEELTELGAQVLNGSINDTKMWEYILLVKKYIDERAQIPLFKHLLKLDTHDARIPFDIGRTLLNNIDADGIPALEKAMSLDPNYTVIACQLITKYCVATGDSKSAQAYRRKALAYQVEAA